MKKIQCWGSL